MRSPSSAVSLCISVPEWSWMEPGSSCRTGESPSPWIPDHLTGLSRIKDPCTRLFPGMVFKDGRFLMSFGVMGGDMQPQGHVQFLSNLIDFKMNLQEAVDAPRIRHIQGMEVYLEDGIPEKTRKALEKKGIVSLVRMHRSIRWGEDRRSILIGTRTSSWGPLTEERMAVRWVIDRRKRS